MLCLISPLAQEIPQLVSRRSFRTPAEWTLPQLVPVRSTAIRAVMIITASGASALQSNMNGFFNTAIGNFALFSNRSGNNNTASGTQALFHNTSGYDNTAT